MRKYNVKLDLHEFCVHGGAYTNQLSVCGEKRELGPVRIHLQFRCLSSVSLKTQMTRFLGHYLNMCRSIHTIKSLCLICFQLPAKTRGVLLSSAAAEDCTAVQ